MRHNGVPAKLVHIIKVLYTYFSAQVICISVYAKHRLDHMKRIKCRQERD